MISKRFISFEGLDFCGKSTQIKLIKKRLLDEYNIEVYVLREPGGTYVSERIRNVLLKTPSDKNSMK